MTLQQTFINGLIGATSSSLAILSTFQIELDWGIRCTGGILGCVVAAWTIIRFAKDALSKKP